jgi:hypothetical protein
MEAEKLIELLEQHNSPKSKVNLCESGGRVLSVKEVLLVSAEGYVSTHKELAGNTILLVGVFEKE